MANENRDSENGDDQGANLELVVHNEDDGSRIELPAGPGTPVRTLIDRMYDRFNLSRQPGDRIRCESGEPVDPYADMALGEFADKHCPDLTWLFAGDQGGALWLD